MKEKVRKTAKKVLAENSETSDKYLVPALERGLRILQEFGFDNSMLGASELARRLNLPRATIFRMLNTLESMGFLERTEGSNEYRLGLAVLSLGFRFLSSLDINELGEPIIKKLSKLLNLSCSIVVRDGRSIVYIAKVVSQVPFASSIRIGARLPAHATVLGHILLGDLTYSELRNLYPEKKLEVFTSQTPKTAEELFDLVQVGKEKGYTVSEGFFEPSICTVAAPVYDNSAKIIAAIGATTYITNFDIQNKAVAVAGVCASASELSELLNYQGSKK